MNCVLLILYNKLTFDFYCSLVKFKHRVIREYETES